MLDNLKISGLFMIRPGCGNFVILHACCDKFHEIPRTCTVRHLIECVCWPLQWPLSEDKSTLLVFHDVMRFYARTRDHDHAVVDPAAVRVN